MRRWFAIVLTCCCLTALRAQDIHFSQMDANPMLLNPAYAGFFNGTGRFGMIYRTQWASVSIPYQTLGVSGEMAVWRSESGKNGLSLGGMVLNDRAGSLHYGTTSAHLSAAYFFALGRTGNNYLSFGLEGGAAQSGFDPSNAEMEDATESFNQTQVIYPLFSTGMAWYWQPGTDFHTKLGFSVRNLNRPNISYLSLEETRLEHRYSFFARAEYRGWQSMSLIPVISYQRQGQYQELVYGADLKWYLEEGGRHEVSIRAGLAYRHADALIASLILEYDAFLFDFCYDANVSGLVQASKGYGAMEVGLMYRLANNKKKVRAYKCPDY